VMIPSTAILGASGSRLAADVSVPFAHDVVPPMFQPQASHPSAGQASQSETLILTFDEIVQAGTGYIEIWEVSNPIVADDGNNVTVSDDFNNQTPALRPAWREPSFRVDISTLIDISHAGMGTISKNDVIITAAGFCSGVSPFLYSNLSLRSNSSSLNTLRVLTECLMPGRAYYITMNSKGVLDDVFGNQLEPLNSTTIWNFTVIRNSSEPPSVLQISKIWYIDNASVAVGFVYFNTVVRPTSSRSTIMVDTCMEDTACNETADVVNATSTFSCAPGMLNESGCAVLRFQVPAPSSTRKYRLVIPQNSVEDAKSSAKGPSSQFTFFTLE